MQKELKAIDAELGSNGYVRIQDSAATVETSLFRALSMAVYLNHQQANDIRQELKLTLINNLADRRNNCYPILSDTNILKKYQGNHDMILDYWYNQELQCFLSDNFQLASAAFGRNKEGYLCQTYITACKHQTKHTMYLSKVGRKFYCTFEATTHAQMQFVKDVIIDELVNAVVLGTEGKKQVNDEKIIIHHYDDIPHRRQHKKSLSDCDDVPVQALLQERKKEFEESFDRGKQNNLRLFDSVEIVNKTEDDYLDISCQSRASYKSADENGRSFSQSYYFPYSYPYYNQRDPAYAINHQQYATEQPYGYTQSFGPINNERYTGRLKFFDQNGNYGFIVIDNLNIDIFVHYDDLSKAGLTKQKLVSMKNHYDLRFQFTYYEYEGKQHKKSKKAIDLKMSTQ